LDLIVLLTHYSWRWLSVYRKVHWLVTGVSSVTWYSQEKRQWEVLLE